jgi:predicted nucleic-acid-binding protein
MLAVDTNVIVRFLTRDDAAEFARADTLFREQQIYIATTVLLETEWVLRSVYRYERTRVVEALRSLSGMRHVTLEDPARAQTALDWTARGMDFADALHLARADDCEAFISFDRRLAAAGRRVGSVPLRTP